MHMHLGYILGGRTTGLNDMAFYSLEKHIKLPSKSVPPNYTPADCKQELLHLYILKSISFLSCFKCGRGNYTSLF